VGRDIPWDVNEGKIRKWPLETAEKRTGLESRLRCGEVGRPAEALHFASACRCAIFAASWDTSKRPKNVQFFGGVAAQNARWWLHHQYRGTDGSQVICLSQILAGRQKIFRSGWQAEIVEGVTLDSLFLPSSTSRWRYSAILAHWQSFFDGIACVISCLCNVFCEGV